MSFGREGREFNANKAWLHPQEEIAEVYTSPVLCACVCGGVCVRERELGNVHILYLYHADLSPVKVFFHHLWYRELCEMFMVLYVWLERCIRVCCSLHCGVNSTFLEALSLDICGHMSLCGVCLSHLLYVCLFISICFGESM